MGHKRQPEKAQPSQHQNFVLNRITIINQSRSRKMEAIGQVFWPEPLSPVFQAGGMLEGWNEDMVFTVMFMGILGVVDLAIVRPFLEPKSRYFALHAVANAFTAIYAFPDVVRMSTDPLNSIGMASY